MTEADTPESDNTNDIVPPPRKKLNEFVWATIAIGSVFFFLSVVAIISHGFSS